jgi:hypothetical protein
MSTPQRHSISATLFIGSFLIQGFVGRWKEDVVRVEQAERTQAAVKT